MDKVEAFIWHDAQGTIVAVGHVVPGTKESVQPRAQPHHKVIKQHLPEGQLASLHLTHAVDIEQGTLRARTLSEDSARPAPKS